MGTKAPRVCSYCRRRLRGWAPRRREHGRQPIGNDDHENGTQGTESTYFQVTAQVAQGKWIPTHASLLSTPLPRLL
uniref:Uncharacterized protein n=1 Tax=Strigamia maritima TaxID=126957 RepID=T1JG31_STRMM